MEKKLNTKEFDFNIITDKNDLILENVKDLSLKDTLECGQIFRYLRLAPEDYLLAAKNKLLHIKNENGRIIFSNTSKDELENFWASYFDLYTDYSAIKNELSKSGEKMINAIEHSPGIRILKQDFEETLISFIISQNRNIPTIQNSVRMLSERFGEFLGSFNGTDYFSFPSASAMLKAGDAALRECKVGFRAPYILDACEKLVSGDISKEKLLSLDTCSARELLMTIKGVGAKVADCVLLFGLGKTDSFPADVWVKRVMGELFFAGRIPELREIDDFSKKNFGSLSGYAQQYLFIYARDNKIGASEKEKQKAKKAK